MQQTYQDKTESGSALYKIHKRITYNIDIVTAPIGTISLVFLVPP